METKIGQSLLAKKVDAFSSALSTIDTFWKGLNILATVFEISSVKVPVINVNSFDNGSSEQFGSPLTNNPAWLR